MPAEGSVICLLTSDDEEEPIVIDDATTDEPSSSTQHAAERTTRRICPSRNGKPSPGDLNMTWLEARAGCAGSVPNPRPQPSRPPPVVKGEKNLEHSGNKTAQELPCSSIAEVQLRSKHSVTLLDPLRELESGVTEASGICFRIDSEDARPVTVRPGQDILVRMEAGLGVAKVLAILQDQQGEPRLGLHYGWLVGDTVELAKLEHPRVTIRYPRRVVWQKDLCSDGKHRVTGPKSGMYKDFVSWSHIAGLCCVKPRSQCTNEELERGMPSEEDLSRSNAAGCMEVFFHDSQQFDSSIMRWEDRYCPEPCGWADIPGPCYIEGRPLSVMDICCGLGTVSLAGRELTRAVRAKHPWDNRGFATEWAFDRDWDRDHKTGRLTPAKCQFPFDSFMDAYGRTKVKRAVSVEELADALDEFQRTGKDPSWGVLPRPGELDLLHASPPCQDLSPLNQHTDFDRASQNLFPLLDAVMRVIEHVRPRFITIEEVAFFLMHRIIKQKGKSGRVPVRCIWRIVLPLQEMGYQVDIRLMNAVHYAVPQRRERLIIFAAKSGHKLPTPMPPWTHWPLEGCGRKLYRDDALPNHPEEHWGSCRMSSTPYHTQHTLPRAVSAREALQDLPAPTEPTQTRSVKYMEELQVYPEANLQRQSPFAAMMHARQLEMGTIRFHCNMRPKVEARNVAEKHKRSPYDSPFPTIFGSNSHHSGSQLHPDCHIDRTLTVAERMRLQSIPDGLPLKGRYHMVMKAVGNAVPMLFGWAVLGSVFEAAYGTPAPRPACLNGRPPWEVSTEDAMKEVRASAPVKEADIDAELAAGTEEPDLEEEDAAGDMGWDALELPEPYAEYEAQHSLASMQHSREEEQCAVSPLHSCSIEIGDPDALEEPRTSSSPELPDQAESTLQLSQLDASQASAQAALLQLACGPGVSWAGGQPCPSRAGAEQELPSKRRRHLRTRKARETDRRNIRTACLLAEGRRALIDYGLASGLPRRFMSLQDIQSSGSSEGPPAYTRPNEHLSAATAANQSDPLLAATADAEPAAAGRAGAADSQPLLLLPEPAAAILENGPTYEIPAEEHQLPSVADAAQRVSLDAQHAMEYPLPSAPGTADVLVDWPDDAAAAEPDEQPDDVEASPEHYLQAHAAPATEAVGELGSCDWASEHATPDKAMPHPPAGESHVRAPAQMQTPDLRTPQPVLEGRRVGSSPAAAPQAAAAAAAEAAEPASGAVEVVRTARALAQAVQSTVDEHMQHLTAAVEEQGHALAGGRGAPHVCTPGPVTPEAAEPACRLPQAALPAEPAPAATAMPAFGQLAAAGPQQMHDPACCQHAALGLPVDDAAVMGDDNSSESMTWRSDSPGIVV